MTKLTLLFLFCFALAGCRERASRPAAIETPAPIPVTAEAETTAAPEGAMAAVTPTPVTATPPAAPIEQVGRTWTSVDGRTLEAELIGRTTETATIRRNADGREFTIPIQSLSEADRRYLAASNVSLTQIKQFDTARLQQLKKSCPPLVAKQPLESTFPNLLDVATKYKRSIDSLSPTGYARGVAMIRADVDADLKRFVPISSTILKSPPIYSNLYGWSQGSGAWKEVWAARSVVEWLNGPFEAYLVELESLR